MAKTIIFKPDNTSDTQVIHTLQHLGVLSENITNEEGVAVNLKEFSFKEPQIQKFTFSEWLEGMYLLSSSTKKDAEKLLVDYSPNSLLPEYFYTLTVMPDNTCIMEFSNEFGIDVEGGPYHNIQVSEQEPFIVSKFYKSFSTIKKIGWNPLSY